MKTPVDGIDFPATLSIASSGDLLVRDTDHERASSGLTTRDGIIRSDGSTIQPLNVGYYDLFNNYLRIDGAPCLYFLQGTPPASYKNKWVCNLDPRSQRIRRLFPLEWDATRGAHLLSDGGMLLEDSQGKSMILAYRVHNWNPRIVVSEIVRRDLASGYALWATRLASQVSALIAMPELGAVVFALNDGQLGALRTSTGEIVCQQSVTVDDVPAVILAFARQGTQLVAGTNDGRIILYECEV